MAWGTRGQRCIAGNGLRCSPLVRRVAPTERFIIHGFAPLRKSQAFSEDTSRERTYVTE